MSSEFTVGDRIASELLTHPGGYPAKATSQAEAAHQLLDALMARVGVDGLVAAMRSPGLLASVDQHAAAVREALASAGHEVDAASLAAYAASVLRVAKRCGRRLPTQPMTDWSSAEWYLLRMLGVCALADAAGCL